MSEVKITDVVTDSWPSKPDRPMAYMTIRDHVALEMYKTLIQCRVETTPLPEVVQTAYLLVSDAFLLAEKFLDTAGE